MKEEYETIDLLEILRLLKKNLLVILAVTILLAVAGYLVSTFAMTPQYEASATLIVNSREDQAAAQAPITNDQLTSATKLVDTYAVILTSDTVLDKTISDLNLNMSYNDLVERVRIESVNSTQVMKITVKDTDPERARAIAADIVEQAPEIIIQGQSRDGACFSQQSQKHSTCWDAWFGHFSRHRNLAVSSEQ